MKRPHLQRFRLTRKLVEATKGKGARDFDFSYSGDASDEAVVIEAKGGESGLGTRFARDGVTHVVQGTEEYLRAVIEEIRVSDPARARQLTKALNAGKLKYFVIRQGFTAAV